MELCAQGKTLEVMHAMYAPEMVSVAADGMETVGRQAVIRKSEVGRADNTIRGDELCGPYFCGDANANSGRFAVLRAPDVTRTAAGRGRVFEEVALYTVEDDKITREECFHDGAFRADRHAMARVAAAPAGTNPRFDGQPFMATAAYADTDPASGDRIDLHCWFHDEQHAAYIAFYASAATRRRGRFAPNTTRTGDTTTPRTTHPLELGQTVAMPAGPTP
jgi:hypothetical protein